MLLFYGQLIADNRAGEAALGADGELVFWEEATRVVDALDQVALPFEFTIFCADEAEDNCFVVGDESEWLERSGAVVVILQKQPVRADILKNLPGDLVVASLHEPATLLIAATQMH